MLYQGEEQWLFATLVQLNGMIQIKLANNPSSAVWYATYKITWQP